jgi:mycothiol synthase
VQRSLQTQIVAFSPAAYSAFTALWNEAYPELKRTELEMRLYDASPGFQASSNRWLAERNGTVIGFGAYELIESESPDERKHQLHLFVSPTHRDQGIGSRLYEQVMAASSSANASLVRVWTRQDQDASLSFLSHRGFAEEMRTFHSSLDTAACDLAKLERYVRRLEKYGYEFKRFDELATDSQRNAKFHELYCEVMQDVPAPAPIRLPSSAEFEQKIVRSPERFSANFIALQRGNYVGLCILLPHGRNSSELYADTLGIRRAFRGRGIAQALSHKGVEYAKKHGYSLISADSFVENRRIATLLEVLGFANKTVWTLFSKRL